MQWALPGVWLLVKTTTRQKVARYDQNIFEKIVCTETDNAEEN